ncbi:MAG: hypothetical protein ACUVXG_14140 [Anaerolineae bacterium]
MVYFVSNTSPTNCDNTTIPKLAKARLAYGTAYYWKIEAVDAHQAVAVGPEWSFTTGAGYYLFLDEPFSTLSAWSDRTLTKFDVNIDNGSAHIYELGWGYEDPYDMDHYIYRQVDITGWQGNMYLKLDWRARSNYASSTVTNARVDFYEGSQSLGSITLVAGGTYDTGWTYGQVFDVTGMLTGRSSVQVRLRIQDGWIAYWAQQAWFDNVKLYSTGLNHRPNTPSSPSPGDGLTGRPTSLNLTWSGGDVDGDIVKYFVYFGTVSPPPYNTNVSSTSIYKSGLAYNTTYYWKIVAQDEHGLNSSGSSPIWRFTTQIPPNNPPNSPSNPKPAHGAKGCPTALSLSWTGGDPNAEDTVTYKIYLDTANPPTTLATETTNTYSLKSGLTLSTTYYWEVLAKDQHEAQAWGPVWNFTVPKMLYGYDQVFDMGKSAYYEQLVPTGGHIANAATQSNLIIVTCQVYDDTEWYNPDFPKEAAKNGLAMIFDVHSLFEYWWFDHDKHGVDESVRIAQTATDCARYRDSLGELNDCVVAIKLFDEPVTFFDGHQMNRTKLTHMRDVVKQVWYNPEKPVFVTFHGQGDSEADAFRFWYDNTGSYYDWDIQAKGVLAKAETHSNACVTELSIAPSTAHAGLLVHSNTLLLMSPCGRAIGDAKARSPRGRRVARSRISNCRWD